VSKLKFMLESTKRTCFILFFFWIMILLPCYSLYTNVSGKLIIEEKFYINNKNNIKNITFIIPFKQHFSNFKVISCVNCTCKYNGTHITAYVNPNTLHDGINIINIIGKIRQNLILPYKPKDLDEVSKFTTSTKNIQSNIESIKEISSLIMDSCDGDRRCFIISSVKWVNEYLIYDTRYSDRNYDTRWILKNKRGVCAEYTTLFISLMRSQGIPSRYVSVLSYDIKRKELIPHAYAEVYIDGVWYPVDVLWKQIGYADALHIYRYYSNDNHVESNINISYLDEIDFKWIDEKINLMNVGIGINNSYFNIANTSLNIEPKKIANISLNISKLKEVKDACVYIKINPCVGGNISVAPKEDIACENLNFFIISYDEDIICPITIQYDTKFSVINMTSSTQLFEINASQSEGFISSLIDLLRKLFNMIISLINSL